MWKSFISLIKKEAVPPAFNCYPTPQELRPLPEITNIDTLIFDTHYNTINEWEEKYNELLHGDDYGVNQSWCSSLLGT